MACSQPAWPGRRRWLARTRPTRRRVHTDSDGDGRSICARRARPERHAGVSGLGRARSDVRGDPVSGRGDDRAGPHVVAVAIGRSEPRADSVADGHTTSGGALARPGGQAPALSRSLDTQSSEQVLVTLPRLDLTSRTDLMPLLTELVSPTSR
ncbi:hypothetical protein CPE01_04210 [Cellulomonas persica]|uniref:Uncharacterized protein n=1 Tax=Cellulomonas persica TaxID=76861 RepID=A0A510UPV5_9CELL|nr:hypothetical protein CPE01_04210 [Cellulomonas persica]